MTHFSTHVPTNASTHILTQNLTNVPTHVSLDPPPDPSLDPSLKSRPELRPKSRPKFPAQFLTHVPTQFLNHVLAHLPTQVQTQIPTHVPTHEQCDVADCDKRVLRETMKAQRLQSSTAQEVASASGVFAQSARKRYSVREVPLSEKNANGVQRCKILGALVDGRDGRVGVPPAKSGLVAMLTARVPSQEINRKDLQVVAGHWCYLGCFRRE